MIIELTSFSFPQTALGRARELAQFELFCHLPRIHRYARFVFQSLKEGSLHGNNIIDRRERKVTVSLCWPGETTPTFCDVPSFSAITLQRLRESQSEPRRRKSHSRAPRRKFPCPNSMELSSIKRRGEKARFRWTLSK